MFILVILYIRKYMYLCVFYQIVYGYPGSRRFRMWVWILAWPVAALVSLSKTLTCNHNCFVLRMGRKAVGPVCCVMHVKEPRTLIVKEKGLAPVFLDSRLEHPAGWIYMYMYVRATNLLYYYMYYMYSLRMTHTCTTVYMYLSKNFTNSTGLKKNNTNK